MDTLDVVEALVWKNPDLRKVFVALDVINENRVITPMQHKEFSNLLSDINNPVIIDAVGLTEMIIIVEPTKIGKTFPTIIIEGNESKITSYSKGGLINFIRLFLNTRDFLPMPLVRKIVYIDDFKSKVNGIMFSEVDKNVWTLDVDPLDVSIKTKAQYSISTILAELLDEILK